MNDFTKEELKELSIVLNEYLNEFTSPESTHQLKNKIIDMIENYKCDHESDGMCYTSNPPQNKCKKCGEFYR